MTFKFLTNETEDSLNPQFATSASTYYKDLVVSNGKTSHVTRRTSFNTSNDTSNYKYFKFVTVFVTNTERYNEMIISNAFKLDWASVFIFKNILNFNQNNRIDKQQLCQNPSFPANISNPLTNISTKAWFENGGNIWPESCHPWHLIHDHSLRFEIRQAEEITDDNPYRLKNFYHSKQCDFLAKNSKE